MCDAKLLAILNRGEFALNGLMGRQAGADKLTALAV